MALNLFNAKVIICVGSGGVGKTTISAALGVAAAQEGLSVLVMTIDPSLRLRQALGLGSNQTEITEVKVPGAQGKLYASLLNAEKIFFDFITQSKDKESTEALLKNRLYKQLSTTLSGSQEFTSLLQLSRVVDNKNYDLVILDTPPAQHAIDFLEAPQKLMDLFQESIVRWFTESETGVGIIQKIIYRGTRVVLSILEKVTGSHFMAELVDFFNSVRGVQAKIAQKAIEIQSILKSKDTKFIVVTAFDETKLIEAELLKNYLDQKAYTLSALIVNRASPTWVPPLDKKLKELYSQWSSYYRDREKTYDTYAKKWGIGLPVLRVKDLNMEVSEIDSLKKVANEFTEQINS
jgi:anion-transporting  ArsA/GET3 family ATPase